MLNSYSPHKALYSNIYAKYENKNRFPYTSAFQTLINTRTNKTPCSSPLYIICHLDTLSIMRQNFNVCREKKLVFIFHLQQTWYKAHTQVKKQKAPGLDNEDIDTEHRCPQEVTFSIYLPALSSASATALGPSPYSIMFAHLGFRPRD